MPTKATTFYKATVHYCLGEDRRKGEGFRCNRPFFFTVYRDSPDDVSLSQIHNKHTNLKRSWPCPAHFSWKKRPSRLTLISERKETYLHWFRTSWRWQIFWYSSRFRWLRPCGYVLSFPRNFLESFGAFECGSISQTSRRAAQCLHWK